MIPARLTSPTVGLSPDHAAGGRGADDRPVGLGADGHRPEVGRDGRGGAGARAAGVPVEHEGVPALPAPGAPAARRMGRADVGPLAHVGLREQDRAGRAEPFGEVGVPRRNGAFERQRAGRGGHPVGGVDVVLEQHRDAVERPARSLGGPLLVERLGQRERLRVGLDDRLERDVLPVHGRDPLEIQLDHALRGVAARRHARLQLGDGDLLELERRQGGGRTSRHRHRRRVPGPAAPRATIPGLRSPRRRARRRGSGTHGGRAARAGLGRRSARAGGEVAAAK